MKKIWLVSLLLLLSVTMTACEKSPTKELTTKTLQELYSGDITKVDSIEITDGSTGARKLFSNKKQVQEWIDQVKGMEFQPDPNQEGRTGYLYAVSLREEQKSKLKFTPHSTGGDYYIHNEKLKKRIQELFENGESTSNR